MNTKPVNEKLNERIPNGKVSMSAKMNEKTINQTTISAGSINIRPQMEKAMNQTTINGKIVKKRMLNDRPVNEQPII